MSEMISAGFWDDLAAFRDDRTVFSEIIAPFCLDAHTLTVVFCDDHTHTLLCVMIAHASL